MLVRSFNGKTRRVVTGLRNSNIRKDKSIFAPPYRFFSDIPVPTPDTSAVGDAVAGAVTTVPPELGWKASHLAMYYVDQVHQLAGVPYWEAILLGTIGLRIALLPIAIKSGVNAGRLKLLQPHMNKLQERMKSDPRLQQDGGDQRAQTQYKAEANALFKKYKVNPFMAFLTPLTQLPIFFSFYFGMTTMGEFFPLMSEGGALWFPDLTVKDTTYYLPAINSALFLLMGEAGSQEMKAEHRNTFKWTMRAVSVAFLPLMAHLPSGLFVYFTTQSFCSILQTVAFKTPVIRSALGMPQIPDEVDESKTVTTEGSHKNAPPNPIKFVSDFIEKERAQSEQAKAVIVDGTSPPGPPKSPKPGPIPATYTQKPKLNNKNKK
jgi:YidC/Oxa1 family membrane protein insertase